MLLCQLTFYKTCWQKVQTDQTVPKEQSDLGLHCLLRRDSNIQVKSGNDISALVPAGKLIKKTSAYLSKLEEET